MTIPAENHTPFYQDHASMCMLILMLTVILGYFAYDFMMPPDKVETTVVFIQGDDKQSREVHFFVPGTAGGVDSCDAPIEVANALQSRSPVIIEQSFVFGRCINVIPDPTRTIPRSRPPKPRSS